MQRCKKCQKPYLSCCGDTSEYCFDCKPREKGTCAIDAPKAAQARPVEKKTKGGLRHG